MKRFSVVAIPMLAVLLFGCGGEDIPEPEQTTQGVEVTSTVPYAHETNQDIIDRGDPLVQDAREAPTHDVVRDTDK